LADGFLIALAANFLER